MTRGWARLQEASPESSTSIELNGATHGVSLESPTSREITSQDASTALAKARRTLAPLDPCSGACVAVDAHFFDCLRWSDDVRGFLRETRELPILGFPRWLGLKAKCLVPCTSKLAQLGMG